MNFEKDNIKVAIYYSGRVEHKNYEANKKKIKEAIKDLTVVHFCSLNERGNSQEFVENFKRDFDISEEKDNYFMANTKVPDNIKNSGIKINVNGNLENMYSMFYHNYKCTEMINKYQEKHNIKFDIVMKYRADIYSEDKLNLKENLEENAIYVPEKYQWSGVNDQIGYGNYESMEKYGECYLHFLEIARQSKQFHPETILMNYLKYKNLKVIKVPYEYKLNKY